MPDFASSTNSISFVSGEPGVFARPAAQWTGTDARRSIDCAHLIADAFAKSARLLNNE